MQALKGIEQFIDHMFSNYNVILECGVLDVNISDYKGRRQNS